MRIVLWTLAALVIGILWWSRPVTFKQRWQPVAERPLHIKAAARAIATPYGARWLDAHPHASSRDPSRPRNPSPSPAAIPGSRRSTGTRSTRPWRSSRRWTTPHLNGSIGSSPRRGLNSTQSHFDQKKRKQNQGLVNIDNRGRFSP